MIWNRHRMPRAAAFPLLLGLLAAGSAWGQDVQLQDALAEMDLSLILPQGIEHAPVAERSDPEYQVAFRFPSVRYEVRISLFPRSWLVRQSGGGNVDRYVPLFSMGLLAAMARESLSFSKTAELPGPTVKKEFGADSGLTTLVRGNQSDFGKGYKEIAVVFLYKALKGVAVISFLFNDPKDLDMDGLAFSQAYYCLRFNEEVPRP